MLDKSYKVRVTPEQSRKIQELVFALGGKWNGGIDWSIKESLPFLYVTNNLVMTCGDSYSYYCFISSEKIEIPADDLIAKLEQLTKKDKTMKLDNFLSTKAKCIKQFDPRFFNSWDVGETYDISITIQVTDKNNDDICFEPQDFIEHFEPVLDEPKPASETNTTQNSVDAVTATNDLDSKPMGTRTVSEPKFKVGDKVYTGLTGDIKTIDEIVNVNPPIYKVVSKQGYTPRLKQEAIALATPENYERLQATFPDIEFEAPPKELTGSDLCRAMLDKGWKYVPCYGSNISEESAKEYKLHDLIRDYQDDSFVGDDCWLCAVPFDPRTGEPLTQAVLDE